MDYYNQPRSSNEKQGIKSKRQRKMHLVQEELTESQAKPLTTSKHLVLKSDVFDDVTQGLDQVQGSRPRRRSSKSDIQTPIPQWRTRWEIGMRPDPIKENQKRMNLSIPDVANISMAAEFFDSNHKPRKKDKQRKSFYYRRQNTNVSEQETEQFDKTSVKSTEVDHFSMLHKTWARADNLCTQTRRLWNLDPKRTSRFLSPDANLKDIQMNEVLPKPTESEFKNRHRRFIKVLPTNKRKFMI